MLVWLALAMILAAQAWIVAPASAAASKEQTLEDLHFRVEYLLWKDVARAQLTLKSLGAGRYQAEISGEPVGLLKVLAGKDRRDSYRTEMIWRDGRLLPLIYREETRKKGKRFLKEYRFDYDRGRLELWQLKEEKGTMVRKWETSLKEPVSDPLSAFYNCRLGLLGPVQEGATFKVTGIPYPKPEEIEVRIGPETQEGRKIMISINNKAFDNDRGVVFAYLDESRVPKQAWTSARVGKISGELLPGGRAFNGQLPEPTKKPAEGHSASQPPIQEKLTWIK
jgi:hypothetical protein